MSYGLYSKYFKYFKGFKNRGPYDVFGPAHKNVGGRYLGTGLPTKSAIQIGNEYVIRIPKHERFRYWQMLWEGETVIARGFLRLFYRGDSIVCVENNKKFLTLPTGWLILPKKTTKTGCKCSTSTIWAQGCQCGGA